MVTLEKRWNYMLAVNISSTTHWLVTELSHLLHILKRWPGDEEYVTMDFFRFDENGKIVEHWDSMLIIPEFTANGNTMY